MTLPQSLTDPTRSSQKGGGEHCQCGVGAARATQRTRNETTAYGVTVLGDGGEVGIAEFPMRYLMKEPVVRVNGDPPEDYEIVIGTFEYDRDNREKNYFTTNATLLVYNTSVGSNTVEIVFEGGCLGDSNNDGDVTMEDALYIASYSARLIENEDLKTYDYSDVTGDGLINIEDALFIASYRAKLLNEYYMSVLEVNLMNKLIFSPWNRGSHIHDSSSECSLNPLLSQIN